MERGARDGRAQARDGSHVRWIERGKQAIHMPGLIVVGQMLHRFGGVVQMRCACVFAIIMMVQHVTGVLGHVFDDRRPTMSAAARMGEITLHGCKRLPWKQQHQENQERLLHVGRTPVFVQGSEWMKESKISCRFAC